MLCIFIEIQACENERISGCLKTSNTMYKNVEKNRYLLPRDKRKSFKKIYFCIENLNKNDPLAVNLIE